MFSFCNNINTVLLEIFSIMTSHVLGISENVSEQFIVFIFMS